MSITTMTFAARDFSARRGASDEHTLQGSVRSEQRRLAEKEPPPEGLRRIWPVAALLVGHRSTWDMLPPRALPQAKFGATNVIVIMFMTTKENSPPTGNFDRGTIAREVEPPAISPKGRLLS